jgi:hypothetical protein
LHTIGTDGPNRRKTTELVETDWTNSSEQEKSDAAYWLLQHVSSNKGEFAQLLAQELAQGDTLDFSVPGYIEQAILWATGLN